MAKKIQKIIKTKEMTKLRPVMSDYDKTYRRFRWNQIEKHIDFFPGKRINAAYNAVDRHAKTWRKNKIALYWQGDDEKEKKEYTFSELSQLSNKFANLLKAHGIKKGDRVFIFLPRVPELYISFLGILKTGAIAGTLFAAFGPEALRDRLQNSKTIALITNNELLKRVEKIRHELPHLRYIFLVDCDKKIIKKKRKAIFDYNEEIKKASSRFKIRRMKPLDSAFILYTSGTTGKPKGVVHCHYAIIQQHITAKFVLDLHESDILWCTADPGWVTGISYGILGPWSNGASVVVFSGRFNPDKWYKIIQDYRVTVWYTAPTAIRMLMRADHGLAKKYDLSSLRHLCSVGEPLNPEAVIWSLKEFGKPFHDNWWQTETGAILIANYACMPIKPGSMGKPFPGIKAAIIDEHGLEVKEGKEGNLAFRPGWPSMMRHIWGNYKKFKSYFLHKNGVWYISGDRAYKDKDGYYWFIGRSDDVIKTAGERVGPFEVESALIEHPAVVEAGVIGKPDPLRGEIIKAFVVLARGYKPSEKLKQRIKLFIKQRLAGHAYPREIDFVNSLPKTRSGKIARRVLKARELGLPLGDISSIEE